MNSQTSRKTNIFLRLIFLINLFLNLSLVGAYLSTIYSPVDVPYLYFFGLAYPIILLLHLFFILFWFFFKKKFIWLNIILIAVGFSYFKSFYSINFSSDNVAEKSIKLMSYNVHIFDLYNLDTREKNKNGIFHFLRNEKPDVICFQEFYHQKNNEEFVIKDSIMSILGTKYYHERYTHEMKNQKYFGLATFSKFPIINKGEVPFTNDLNNFCIYSDIIIEDDTVRVFNAHIGSIRFQKDDYDFFTETISDKNQLSGNKKYQILRRLKLAYEKRALQIETIMDKIKASEYPVLFVGDLNDTPVSYCYNQVSDFLVDAFLKSGIGVGTTYVGEIPSNRIDYIFHDQKMSSSNFITYDEYYSDHKPISCLINL